MSKGPTESTLKRYKKAKALMGKGFTLREASDKAGIATSQVYKVNKFLNGKTKTVEPKHRRITKRKVKTVEIPEPTTNHKVAAIVGSPKDVANFLENFNVQ